MFSKLRGVLEIWFGGETVVAKQWRRNGGGEMSGGEMSGGETGGVELSGSVITIYITY